MWFKSATIYRIPQYWKFSSAQELEQALAAHQSTPLGSMESIAHGWVHAYDNNLVHKQGEHLLMKLRTQKKLLPASVIKEKVAEAALNIEIEAGFKPGKKLLKEIKEDVIAKLLPTALSVSKDTPVWLDINRGWLVVGTSSAIAAETVVSKLIKAVEKLPLETLHVAKPISTTLTNWLSDGEAPNPFTVDMDAVLAEKTTKAKVKYTQHGLDGQDLQLHIEQGKQCTELALTWNERVSFVMTEKAQFKKIKALDILEEQEANEDMDQFNSDFALMTGELSKLIGDLIAAFGGVVEQEKEAA